jgi:hypothetical protein
VGIYVGKLRFVNAPSTGGTVRLDYLTNPYWAKRFDGIRRVAGPAAKPVPFDAPSYQAAAPQTERAITPAASTADRSGEALAANAPLAATRAVSAYSTGSSPSQVTARAGAEPRASSNAAAEPALATTAATRAPQADPFEPPPPAMSAAQIQARAAGAVSPTPALSAQPNGYDGGASAQAQRQAAAGTPPVSQTATARGADAIDAAADAFEPPPASSVAARQARQARQADAAERAPADNGSVQIMRASTASRSLAAPSQTNDDPIARFANGNF